MGALTAIVDTYAGTDPTTLDDLTLGERIVEIETSMRRLAAVKADALRVFDARDAGGETCAANGLLRCRWHHHCIHNRGHQIKLLPDGTAETTLPDGRVLVSRPRGPTRQ